ncbi:MAG: flavodoxin family protein [Spirochaetes bacterium]|nr:MAG: flavodoxin family protein [Spirochaetota bacterium]
MEVRIVAVSGSPVKKGNVNAYLDHLRAEAEKAGALFEAVRLAELEIRDCVHCNFCLRKQAPGRYCSIKDDAQPVFEMLEAADVILLSSPVYFMRTSGMMASFIDRLRVFVFGNLAGGKLKNKVGLSAAVAWARHGGLETTHLSHIYAFLTLEMIPVSVHHCVSPLGASGVASRDGSGLFDREVRLGVEQDAAGLHAASAMIARALELAAIMKKGAG